jgi:hypothetical protein
MPTGVGTCPIRREAAIWTRRAVCAGVAFISLLQSLPSWCCLCLSELGGVARAGGLGEIVKKCIKWQSSTLNCFYIHGKNSINGVYTNYPLNIYPLYTIFSVRVKMIKRGTLPVNFSHICEKQAFGAGPRCSALARKGEEVTNSPLNAVCLFRAGRPGVCIKWSLNYLPS